MNIEQAYINFINLVNRNATNNNVNVDKSRFIIMFRSVQIQYLDFILKNRKNDTVRRASHLLVYKQPIELDSSEEDRDTFKLPLNYFSLSNLHVEASKDSCKNVKLSTFEVKTEDLEELFTDKFNNPSFKYGETSYFVSQDDTVTVLKDGFELSNVYLTYYKKPVEVDIEGYLDKDGNPSSNIDPDWDDIDVEKILLAMSKEFAGINNDTTQYQISKDRFSNF